MNLGQPMFKQRMMEIVVTAGAIGRALQCHKNDPLSLRFNGHFPGEPGLAGVY